MRLVQRAEVEAGSVLAGRYRLLSVLGRGGMGVVFRGVHLGTDRPVAVKVLRRELMADRTLAKRFVREAKAAAALRHPNVVDVIDYGVDDEGTAYQVLELLEGASLGELLARERRLPIETALALIAPVMHALSVAHGRGVVHRDLKPDNIFLAKNARGRIVPKLLDFGIAKMLEAPGSAPSTLNTRVGTAIGTPAYMSPEQAGATGDVGVTTDVWAIGVILFECIAGRLPFEADTGAILMARIITELAPSITTIAKETPAPIAAVIDRALAALAEDRWQTMAEFDAALRAAAAESGVAVPPADASDLPAMSLPPPRPEEIVREPISSGEDAVQLFTRQHESGQVTREVRQPPIKVGGEPIAMHETPSGPSTVSERTPLPIARIAVVVSVVIALVSLALWMRAPDTDVASDTPPPVVAPAPVPVPVPVPAPVPVPEPIVTAPAPVPEPVAPDPTPSAVVAPEPEPPPAIEPRPRDRRRTTTTTEAEAPPTRERRAGEQLPELTEW